MVNAEFLEKSYKSRPRKSVVVSGFVSLLLVLAAFAFTYLYINMPELFAFLDGVKTSFPEADNTLRELLNFYYTHVLIAIILLHFPVSTIVKTACKRAVHWFLAVPALLLHIGLLVCWVLFCIPPIAETFDPVIVMEMQTKYLGLALYAQMGLLAFCSFIEMCYCGFSCFTFREIYHLRHDAIVFGKKHQGIPGIRTPAQVRRDFYDYYQRKDWESMLELFFVHVFEKVKSEKLTSDEFAAFTSFCAKRDADIRKAEFDYLNDRGDSALLYSIYCRLSEQAARSDVGQKKAAEDAAYDRLVRKEKPVLASAPKPSVPLEVHTMRPTAPVPPPSAVGEAWKDKK